MPNNGPVQINGGEVIHSSDIGYVADPQGDLIGHRPIQWIDRLLTATVEWNTRRL
jgi:hypothetical protein